MRILFISIAWPSKGQKNLYTDLMHEFVLNGHSVYVIGTSGSEKSSETELKEENGIQVLRIDAGTIRKTSYYRKAYSMLMLGSRFFNAIKKYMSEVEFDLIIGPTPPITLSRLYKKLKRRYRAPFYLLLKDIWPQDAVDLKVIRKFGIPWIYLRSHEIRLYKTADYIGCMSPLGAQYLLSKNRFIPKARVEVCPNSIRPVEETAAIMQEGIRAKYKIPHDACLFIFSGNLGVGHGLQFLAEAIASLSDYSKAYFVIGGSGTQFKYLKEMLDKGSPNNVFLYSWLPREDFEQILAASDVGLILLYKYTSPQFPSRLLSYFEYSKPALCAVNNATDIGTMVEKSGCGKSVNHGDLERFVAAVKFFSENASERMRMGANGRKLLIDQLTVTHSYEIIMNHFKE